MNKFYKKSYCQYLLPFFLFCYLPTKASEEEIHKILDYSIAEVGGKVITRTMLEEIEHGVDLEIVFTKWLIQELVLHAKGDFDDIKEGEQYNIEQLVEERIALLNKMGKLKGVPEIHLNKIREEIKKELYGELAVTSFIEKLFDKMDTSPRAIKKYLKKMPLSKIPKTPAEVLIKEIVYYKFAKLSLPLIKKKLEKVHNRYIKGKITFKEAMEACKLSNMGRNRQDGSSEKVFVFEKIPKKLQNFFTTDKSKWQIGTLSKPHIFTTKDNEKVVRLLIVEKITPAYSMTIEKNFPMIKAFYLREMQKKIFKKWIRENKKKIIILCDEDPMYQHAVDSLEDTISNLFNN